MFLKVKAGNIMLIVNLGSDLSKANELVSMFESNVKYIQDDYNGFTLLQANQVIELGGSIELSKSSYCDEQHLTISGDNKTIGFIKAENNVFANLDKIKDGFLRTITDLRKENDNLRKKNQLLEAQIEVMKEDD